MYIDDVTKEMRPKIDRGFIINNADFNYLYFVDDQANVPQQERELQKVPLLQSYNI
jgi:hypothetical protein